jgi:hypothetical protein
MSGFVSPNYTQTPNDLFEMIPFMGCAEMKVTLVAIRQTFGYHRERARLSLTRMEELTGLSRQGVIDGADAAEKRGTLTRIQDGGVTEWVVNVVDLPGPGGQASRPAVVKPVDQPGQASRPPSNKENSKEKEKEETKPTGADAPRAGKPVKVKTQRDLITEELVKQFSTLTHLGVPPHHTERLRSEARVHWFNPLWEIYGLTKDLPFTVSLLRDAVWRSRQRRLNLSSPLSIKKIALSLYAEGSGYALTPEQIAGMRLAEMGYEKLSGN